MSSAASASSWKPPSWSCSPPPTHRWHLDELKNGHVVATHSLNDILSSSSHNNNRRSSGCCVTFGRLDDPTQIDILTAHESCSRLHARIAFTSSGTPYLKDLGSGNGTFVNRQRLPAEACGKVECASTNNSNEEDRGIRGVVVYPGDAIQFGCSTRIFVLEGPEEFERGAAASAVPRAATGGGAAIGVKLKKETNRDHRVENIEGAASVAAAASEKNQEVCNWGVATAEYSDEWEEDAPPPLQHQLSSSNNRSSNNKNNNNMLPTIESFFQSDNFNNNKYTISNPLQHLYNQYQTKLQKFNSISTESHRISQKADMGIELTDGQLNQLQKNQDRLDMLDTSITELKDKIEEGMNFAIYGNPAFEKKEKKKRGGEGDYGGDDADDVDEFYDRTVSSSTTSKQRQYYDDDDGGEADSEESLIQKWKVIVQSYFKQQNVLSSTMKRCAKLQNQIDSVGNDDEEGEDTFFMQNDLNLVKENVTKATRRLEAIEQELNDTECLLKIVNPKLSWDRGVGLIGIDDWQITNATMTRSHHDHDVVQQMNTNTTENKDEEEEQVDSIMMPPPPKMMSFASENKSVVTFFDMMMPPPAPKAVTLGAPASRANIATSPTPSGEAGLQGTEAEEEQQKPQNRKRQFGPTRPPPPTSSATTAGTRGTLAALQQFSVSHSNDKSTNNDESTSRHEKRPKKSNDDNINNATTFDTQKDEWNVPKDQDGSGRTSLHDKFQGRY